MPVPAKMVRGKTGAVLLKAAPGNYPCCGSLGRLRCDCMPVKKYYMQSPAGHWAGGLLFFKKTLNISISPLKMSKIKMIFLLR